MSKFFAVLSFPFWFFGLTFVIAALSDKITMTINNATKRMARPSERLFAFVFGIICIGIAWLMCSI